MKPGPDRPHPHHAGANQERKRPPKRRRPGSLLCSVAATDSHFRESQSRVLVRDERYFGEQIFFA